MQIELTSCPKENLLRGISAITSKYKPIVSMPDQTKSDILNPTIYISNHQNIIMDGSLVCYGVYEELLFKNRLDLIPQFVIGSNLFGHDKKLDALLQATGAIRFEREGVELARSFKRIYETLNSSKSIWIAQSPGRSKDGLFRTNSIITKGLSRSNTQIIPVRVNYEFEPTVGLMAYQQLNGKTSSDDKHHMMHGMTGKTGKITINFGTAIKAPFTPNLATEIDTQMKALFTPSSMNRFINDETQSQSELIHCIEHVFEQERLVGQIHSDADIPKLETKILEFYKNNEK